MYIRNQLFQFKLSLGETISKSATDSLLLCRTVYDVAIRGFVDHAVSRVCYVTFPHRCQNTCQTPTVMLYRESRRVNSDKSFQLRSGHRMPEHLSVFVGSGIVFLF